MRKQFILLFVALAITTALTRLVTYADGGHDSGGEITGVIEMLPSLGLVGDWRISGRTVRVTASTRINQEHGAAAVGSTVEAKGTSQSDGSLRASEIEVKSGRGAEIEVSGIIEGLPALGLIGDWRVAGKTIHVTLSTRIALEHGAPSLGSHVEVKGSRGDDGSITATEIKVKDGAELEGEITGRIESLPASGLIGDWRVGGKTVHVNASTRIDQEHGTAAVGASVEVKGTSQSDGSLTAAEIEVKSGTGGDAGAFIEIHGAVEGLPSSGLIGDWRVAGQLIHVTAGAVINQEHSRVSLGVMVEVKGRSQPDHSITATRIEVQSSPGDGSATEFFGLIEHLPTRGLTGTWTISGRAVQVTDSTTVEQESTPAAAGAFVEVQGWLQPDGAVRASRIEVKGTIEDSGPVSVAGAVQDLPASGLLGDWVVDGRTIHVTASTSINEDSARARIGSRVKIKGTAQTDGSVAASKIKVKR